MPVWPDLDLEACAARAHRTWQAEWMRCLEPLDEDGLDGRRGLPEQQGRVLDQHRRRHSHARRAPRRLSPRPDRRGRSAKRAATPAYTDFIHAVRVGAHRMTDWALARAVAGDARRRPRGGGAARVVGRPVVVRPTARRHPHRARIRARSTSPGFDARPVGRAEPPALPGPPDPCSPFRSAPTRAGPDVVCCLLCARRTVVGPHGYDVHAPFRSEKVGGKREPATGRAARRSGASGAVRGPQRTGRSSSSAAPIAAGRPAWRRQCSLQGMDPSAPAASARPRGSPRSIRGRAGAVAASRFGCWTTPSRSPAPGTPSASISSSGSCRASAT